MLKHSLEVNHPAVKLGKYTIVSSGYWNKKLKMKVSESLFIKHNRLSLNKHDTSVPLKLLNPF